MKYTTEKGLKLQQSPFSDFAEQLTDPEHYTSTRQLGKAMREHGIEAFEYKSARDKDHGLNTALYSPNAIVSKAPLYQQQWLCDTNSRLVSFYSSVNGKVYKFPINSFLVNGKFPEPAF